MNDIAQTVAGLTLFQKAALLSGANTWQTRAIDEAGISAIWMADGPHGIRKQIGSADHLGINGSQLATCFPTSATVANSWDEQLAEEIGTALGREASAQGVNVLLGPGLNIKRSPLGGRSFEYFSEDPELAGRLAAAYVRGIQSQGVAASPKHFAVNSQELRRMVSDSVVDERTLHEIYLTAFEIVVRESDPWTIMSAYNLINGEYAHEHGELLTEVLRERWGFDGAVVSDWGGANDAVAAVYAGGTLEMPSPGYGSAREIAAAVENGALSEAVLDARVTEVLTLVQRVTDHAAAAVDLAEQHALARRAAAQSAVLLRNESMLPLAGGTRVALVGDFVSQPRYQGAGSSLVNAARVTTLESAIADTDLVLTGVARGFHRDGTHDAQLIAEAVTTASAADVVVLALGLPESAESEGLDRSTLALPANQVELLTRVAAANPRTVVVLSAGGVVELGWQQHAAALVHAYLGGQAGAEAILDVLTGAVEPGGRLAETFPHALADTPTAGRFPSTRRTSEYREGLHVGYRYYDAADVDVAYPFGYGLGYTTFEFSDLTADQTGATVTVTNTGSRAGSEVAQLYVGRSGATGIRRPHRELKAFARVTLGPGESAVVRLALGDRAFRHYDADARDWAVESGEFEIAVGRHSRDLPLTHRVTVTGSVDAGSGVEPGQVASPDALRSPSDDEFAAALGRPIPAGGWTTGRLGFNDPIDSIRGARSRTARVAYRVIDRKRRKGESAGHPDLNMLFMLNAPFRVLSKMSGGLATSELTAAVLTAVNGRTFRGLAAVIGAFLRGRRLEKRSHREFTAPTTRGQAPSTERTR